jgi:ribosomal silencing factor RsfS
MTGKELFESFKALDIEEQSTFLAEMVAYSKHVKKNVNTLRAQYGENLEHLKERNPAGYNKEWVKQKMFGT